MKNTPKNSEFLYTIPNNFENTKIKLRPFYHTDLRTTLENIVFTEKPEKGILEKISSRCFKGILGFSQKERSAFMRFTTGSISKAF